MKKVFNRFEKFMDFFESSVCSVGLLLTIVVVSINVFSDLILNRRSVVFEELASVGYIWVTYASMGYLYRKRDLMEVSFVVNSFPARLKYLAELLREVYLIAFGFIMVYFGIKLCQGGLVKKLVSTQIPYFYIDIAIVIGFLSQTLFCLKDLIVNLAHIKEAMAGSFAPEGWKKEEEA